MIVGLIQAHMGSKRLPGKVLMEVDGEPLLKIQIDRLRRAKLDKLAVITSGSPQDDVIVDWCRSYGVDYFRGSDRDVLDRYYRAAVYFKADVIVRICSDCPLLCPDLVDDLVGWFSRLPEVECLSNWVRFEANKYPDGMDVAVLTTDCLARVWLEAENPQDREHVITYIYNNRNNFNAIHWYRFPDLSQYKLSVDTADDFKNINRIYREIKQRKIFGDMYDIVSIMEETN